MKNPGVRSPRDKVGGMVYFGRMVDKIRRYQEGRLPEDLVENLGKGFDDRCCRFLRIRYEDLCKRVAQGGSDEEILEWAMTNGRRPDPDDLEMWNDFMTKRGWNDEVTERLKFRLAEAGVPHRTDIQTMFDYIDFDEGRIP
jgi:gluconokinase